MRQIIIAGLALLGIFLAAPSFAATVDVWVSTPGGDSATEGTCRFPRDRVCFLDSATTSETPLLFLAECENYTVTFVANIADNTLFANTLGWYDLSGTTIDATNNDAAILVQNATLNGNPAASLEAIKGDDAYFGYGEYTNSTGTSRIRVHCHPRK